MNPEVKAKEVQTLSPTPQPDDTAVEDNSEAESKAFIYQHESGNRTDAINPSSGACGLGQSLPCSNLTCSLSDYQCQDEWFTAYMLRKYGTWKEAVAFWKCIGVCTNKYATVNKTATWW